MNRLKTGKAKPAESMNTRTMTVYIIALLLPSCMKKSVFAIKHSSVQCLYPRLHSLTKATPESVLIRDTMVAKTVPATKIRYRACTNTKQTK